MLLFAVIAVLVQADAAIPPRSAPDPAPIPPARTWDGAAGFETIVTDRETGQVTFPLGRQPTDALSRSCVFGLSNVRCPAPRSERDFERMVASTREQAERLDGPVTLDANLGARVDCTTDTTQSDQRLCAFTEALHNSRVDAQARLIAEAALSPEERAAREMDWGQDLLPASTKPEAPAVGRLGFATGRANDKGDAPEPEEQPAQRSGCRREEYRNPDGSGWSVRFVCGSGDQRLLDDVMGRLGGRSD